MLPFVEEAMSGGAETSTPESATIEADALKDDEENMASSAERMMILRMVEQGKISAEEGARLLAALGGQTESESKPRTNVFDTSRLLQVRVSDLVNNRQKVNVNVPVGLFQLVWRWLPATAQEEIEKVQQAIESGASGRIVEVVDQDSGVRVEITLVS
jgi:hypothetical protein